MFAYSIILYYLCGGEQLQERHNYLIFNDYERDNDF